MCVYTLSPGDGGAVAAIRQAAPPIGINPARRAAGGAATAGAVRRVLASPLRLAFAGLARRAQQTVEQLLGPPGAGCRAAACSWPHGVHRANARPCGLVP